VFGGVVAMSTHWIGSGVQNATIPLSIMQYMNTKMPWSGRHRIYMDHGTLGIDANYGVHQAFIDVMMRERKYSDDDFLSLRIENAAHDEDAWRARTPTALAFMLRKSTQDLK
jgi:hypothetical protein